MLGVAVTLSVFGLVMGCGGSGGPTRYTVEGKVTFGGKPVPAGEITFEPDPAKGNKGPAGYGIIDDGRYATSPGKGVVGGPHVVRITGNDGKASGESPYGRSLFESYRVEVDLPKQDTSQDFDVPASQP